MDNGTFYIKWAKMEDGDHYGCTAGNSGGLKREEIILVVHSTGKSYNQTDFLFYYYN